MGPLCELHPEDDELLERRVKHCHWICARELCMEGTNKEIYERGVARREKIENDVEYVIKDRRAFDNI